MLFLMISVILVKQHNVQKHRHTKFNSRSFTLSLLNEAATTAVQASFVS